MNEIQIIAWRIIKVGIVGILGISLYFLIKKINKELKQRKVKPKKKREDSFIDMIIDMLPHRIPFGSIVGILVGLGVTVMVLITVLKTMATTLSTTEPTASLANNVTTQAIDVFSSLGNSGIGNWFWLVLMFIPAMMLFKMFSRMFRF